MPKFQGNTEFAQRDTSIPALVDNQIQRATYWRASILTEYENETDTVSEDTRIIIDEANIMHLSREDQIRIAEALITPPKPNERLARAAQRHAELVEHQLKHTSKLRKIMK